VTLVDAVSNIQRAALLQALISEHRFDLFSEAFRDRLHQPHRAAHCPGMTEVLQMNEQTRDHPGLLGVAMSGAGSTAIAFATENFESIGVEMAGRFAAHKVKARWMEVAIDNRGRVVREIDA
jgi:homoserine kinase